MKKRVYLETTVVSYFTAKPSLDSKVAGHQAATRELWPLLAGEYETHISVLVYEESRRGDPAMAQKRLEAFDPFIVLEIDGTARDLAGKILAGKGVPAEYPEDALHIAIAAVNGMDVFITWNFAHLSNPFTRSRIRTIVEGQGYVCPEICSPEELLEAEK